MENKIRPWQVFIFCAVIISLAVWYTVARERSLGPINPPKVLNTDIIIDLKSPTEGTIDAPSGSIAGSILSQYYIRIENVSVQSPFNFFALNQSEFPGPVYVFRQRPVKLFYRTVNMTVIFPEGYKVIYENMQGGFQEGETYTSVKAFTPVTPPVFEGGRWTYFISSDELDEAARVPGFQSVELLYAKVEK